MSLFLLIGVFKSRNAVFFAAEEIQLDIAATATYLPIAILARQCAATHPLITPNE